MAVIVCSNFISMRNWSERRGVSDDLCYLRQAHLFQKHGIRGIDTDLAGDTDNYFKSITADAGHPEWGTSNNAICHVEKAATNKYVLQYPPGTGFLLALFPEGKQVFLLYATATIAIFAMLTIAIALAKTQRILALVGLFGCAALYFMINPAKASYSMAPTMVICSVAGYFTARIFRFEEHKSRLPAICLLGLLLGLTVDLRVANLFLSGGYFAFLALQFVRLRNAKSLAEGFGFTASYLVGMAPILLANSINAGSPFSTTYNPADVGGLDLSFSISREYFSDTQGGMVALTVLAILIGFRTGLWAVSLTTALNLAINLAYFLSYPIYTQYYLMPISMLSLWTMLFSALLSFSTGSSARSSRVTLPALLFRSLRDASVLERCRPTDGQRSASFRASGLPIVAEALRIQSR